MEETAATLSGLVDKQLSAVVFVQDYLQLQFDGLVLTILNPVTVIERVKSYRLGDLPFRDALCARITHHVMKIELAKELLSIHFDDGSYFLVSLKSEDYVGPEAINFPDGRVSLAL